MRCGVLGYSFSGYLLQRPFTAMRTRRIDVHVNAETPKSPVAMLFAVGGVVLAAPLAQGATVAHADVVAAGWDVYSSDAVAPNVVHLRLEPSEVDAVSESDETQADI